MKETFTRASRNRRVVALMAWAGLVVTAFSLWNSRLSGFIRVVTAEPVAFILAAFAAFVGVFAWMLYNPGRRSAAESPGLFLAMATTLFPPPIIGFCLMPDASPLRWWLALGVFLLCVIAVLSHVPDEFFNVPRGRHTYLAPIPTFDRVRDKAMDPNAAWFTFSDLSRIVSDTDRPSLVPRDYLQQRDSVRSSSSATPIKSLMPFSEVDDILGPDFDTDFMSDLNMGHVAEDLPIENRSLSDYGQYGQRSDRKTEKNSRAASRSRTSLRGAVGQHATTAATAAAAYRDVNPRSLRIAKATSTHRRDHLPQYMRGVRSQRQRISDSIRIERNGRRDGRSAIGNPGRTTPSVFAANVPVAVPHPQQEDIAAKNAANSSYQNASVTNKAAQVRSMVLQQQRDADAVDLRQKAEQQRLQRELAERERAEQKRVEQVRIERERGEKQRLDRERLEHLERSEQRQRERLERERAEREEAERPSRALSEIVRSDGPENEGRQSPSYRRKGQRSALSSEPQTIVRDTSPKAGKSVAEYATAAMGTAVAARTLRADVAEIPAIQKVTESVAEVDSRQSKRRIRQETPEFERTSDEHGGELVEGVMRVRFDIGQKRANLHVPFSPPLAGMPEVECECVGGEDIRLKVPVRQSYGIRIEARRSNADQAMEAEVGFAAVYTPE